MDITKKSAELMLDLVEIKLSMMQVNDRDDAKELSSLRACREELLKIIHSSKKTISSETFQKL
ncbi:MAG: hypothetical protein H6492_00695 [Candidatus Paracaedibacteraceae bacterium]|nr:hypothetical protein [Candidatus Paracaedibacteraceae bacterium]